MGFLTDWFSGLLGGSSSSGSLVVRNVTGSQPVSSSGTPYVSGGSRPPGVVTSPSQPVPITVTRTVSQTNYFGGIYSGAQNIAGSLISGGSQILNTIRINPAPVISTVSNPLAGIIVTGGRMLAPAANSAMGTISDRINTVNNAIRTPIAAAAIPGGAIISGGSLAAGYIAGRLATPKPVQAQPTPGGMQEGATYRIPPTLDTTGPDTFTLYVSHGHFTHVPVSNLHNLVLDKESGAFGGYEIPRGHSISNLATSGGPGAAQSGQFSFTPLTPNLESRETGKPLPGSEAAAAAIRANPQGYSRLGAEAYGGKVMALDGRTVQSTGAQYGVFPAESGNLASLVNAQGVNKPKSEWGEIPWSIDTTNTPKFSYVDKGGNIRAIPGSSLSAAGLQGRISIRKSVGGAAAAGQQEVVGRYTVPSGLQLALQPKTALERGGFDLVMAAASVPFVGDLVKAPVNLYHGRDMFTEYDVEITQGPATVTSESTKQGTQWQTVETLSDGRQRITTFIPSTTTTNIAASQTATATPRKGLFEQMEQAWVSPAGKALPDWNYNGEVKSPLGAAQAIVSGGYMGLKEKPATAAVYAASAVIMVLGGEAVAGLGAGTQAGLAAAGMTRAAAATRGMTWFATKGAPAALGGLYTADLLVTGYQPTISGGGINLNPTAASMRKMGGRIATEVIPMVGAGWAVANRAAIASGVRNAPSGIRNRFAEKPEMVQTLDTQIVSTQRFDPMVRSNVGGEVVIRETRAMSSQPSITIAGKKIQFPRITSPVERTRITTETRLSRGDVGMLLEARLSGTRAQPVISSRSESLRLESFASKDVAHGTGTLKISESRLPRTIAEYQKMAEADAKISKIPQEELLLDIMADAARVTPTVSGSRTLDVYVPRGTDVRGAFDWTVEATGAKTHTMNRIALEDYFGEMSVRRYGGGDYSTIITRDSIGASTGTVEATGMATPENRIVSQLQRVSRNLGRGEPERAFAFDNRGNMIYEEIGGIDSVPIRGIHTALSRETTLGGEGGYTAHTHPGTSIGDAIEILRFGQRGRYIVDLFKAKGSVSNRASVADIRVMQNLPNEVIASFIATQRNVIRFAPSEPTGWKWSHAKGEIKSEYININKPHDSGSFTGSISDATGEMKFSYPEGTRSQVIDAIDRLVLRDPMLEFVRSSEISQRPRVSGGKSLGGGEAFQSPQSRGGVAYGTGYAQERQSQGAWGGSETFTSKQIMSDAMQQKPTPRDSAYPSTKPEFKIGGVRLPVADVIRSFSSTPEHVVAAEVGRKSIIHPATSQPTRQEPISSMRVGNLLDVRQFAETESKSSVGQIERTIQERLGLQRGETDTIRSFRVEPSRDLTTESWQEARVTPIIRTYLDTFQQTATRTDQTITDKLITEQIITELPPPPIPPLMGFPPGGGSSGQQRGMWERSDRYTNPVGADLLAEETKWGNIPTIREPKAKRKMIRMPKFRMPKF